MTQASHSWWGWIWSDFVNSSRRNEAEHPAEFFRFFSNFSHTLSYVKQKQKKRNDDGKNEQDGKKWHEKNLQDGNGREEEKLASKAILHYFEEKYE